MADERPLISQVFHEKEITEAEMAAQADSLATTVGLGTPEQIAAVIVLFDRHTGNACVRGVKIDTSRMRQIMRLVYEGKGAQRATEVV